MTISDMEPTRTRTTHPRTGHIATGSDTGDKRGSHAAQSMHRRMYTVTEAARLLGIGRSTAYELVVRGELAATRIGRRWLISPTVLEAILGERPPLPHELATGPRA